MAEVEDSILKTIKQMLMLGPAEDAFDTDLIIHINSVFATLLQLGIGPDLGFRITGEDEKWTEFLDGEDHIDSVKTYTYIKVKLVFDPPPTSFAITSFQEMAREIEWRINVHREEREHPWVQPLPVSSTVPEVGL